MKNLSKVIAVLSVAGIALTATAAEAGSLRARGSNGFFGAAAGPNGGAAMHGRGYRQNSDGSLTGASGGVYRLPNGGVGGRASTTTVNPDGSLSRSGTFGASGPNGNVNSSGSFARDASGTWSGARNTQATNNNTGVSYQGSTTIDPATGKPVHTGTCYDVSGATIACPSR